MKETPGLRDLYSVFWLRRCVSQLTFFARVRLQAKPTFEKLSVLGNGLIGFLEFGEDDRSWPVSRVELD